MAFQETSEGDFLAISHTSLKKIFTYSFYFNFLKGIVMQVKKVITWIILLDSKEAHVFCKDENHYLRDLKKTLKLEPQRTDTPFGRRDLGRSYDSFGAGRHIIEPHTSDKTQDRIHFANSISSFLEDALKNEEYDQLVLVAPEKMLGLLRKRLSQSVRKTITLEINKNFMQLTPTEIQEHLDTLPDLKTSVLKE